MDLDLKFDIESIKALPRLLIVIISFLIVDLLVILYVVGFFSDDLDEQLAQLTANRASVADLRHQLASVRDDVASFDDLNRTYEQFAGPTAMARSDRVTLVRVIEGLRAKHRLTGLHFRFAPGVVSPLADTPFQIVEAPIELEGESALDSDLVAFWQEAVGAISPDDSLTSFTLERMQQPTPASLQLIRDGQPQVFVTGKVQFQALSLRRPVQAKEGL